MAREKKSEKLEVRLTHREKSALQLEAKASNLTVSQLVRSVLERHIRSQPYLDLALRPVRKHPRAAMAALAVGICTLGLGPFLSPDAHTQEITFEILGRMEPLEQTPPFVRRFSSKLTLDDRGQGVYYDPGVPSDTDSSLMRLAPHTFEVSVIEQDASESSLSESGYFVALRILRQDNENEFLVSEPSTLTSLNSITNLEFTSNDGVRYGLIVRVIPASNDTGI